VGPVAGNGEGTRLFYICTFLGTIASAICGSATVTPNMTADNFLGSRRLFAWFAHLLECRGWRRLLDGFPHNRKPCRNGVYRAAVGSGGRLANAWATCVGCRHCRPRTRASSSTAAQIRAPWRGVSRKPVPPLTAIFPAGVPRQRPRQKGGAQKGACAIGMYARRCTIRC
jgi:hypothetical protein